GVERRNTMLLEKSAWVARLQDNLRVYSAEAQQGQVTFIIGCDAPRGYSIYGLNRLELLVAPEFVGSTLSGQGSASKAAAIYQDEVRPETLLSGEKLLSVGADATVRPYAPMAATVCGP